MQKRKPTPKAVHSMAYHRGLSVHKARRGGWYIVLSSPNSWGNVLYATHNWDRVRSFIMKYPILIKRREAA